MGRSAGGSLDEGMSLGGAMVNAGLSPKLASKLESLPMRPVHVDPKRPFREPGTCRDEVIFVRSGILSKFKAGGSGRRQIIALRFAGDGMLPHEGTSDYGIQAIVRSEILLGRAADFHRFVDAHPEVARFFWKLTQRHAEIGYEWLVNCGRRDSVGRVAHLLCETAERIGIRDGKGRLRNPFTQQHIADITGQTPVNVNRVFADLERQGLIRREGREIEFCDWAEMQRVASFQPGYLRGGKT